MITCPFCDHEGEDTTFWRSPIGTAAFVRPNQEGEGPDETTYSLACPECKSVFIP